MGYPNRNPRHSKAACKRKILPIIWIALMSSSLRRPKYSVGAAGGAGGAGGGDSYQGPSYQRGIEQSIPSTAESPMTRICRGTGELDMEQFEPHAAECFVLFDECCRGRGVIDVLLEASELQQECTSPRTLSDGAGFSKP
eukprot:3308581-Pleurochrysis_carterae.AAC.2